MHYNLRMQTFESVEPPFTFIENFFPPVPSEFRALPYRLARSRSVFYVYIRNGKRLLKKHVARLLGKGIHEVEIKTREFALFSDLKALQREMSYKIKRRESTIARIENETLELKKWSKALPPETLQSLTEQWVSEAETEQQYQKEYAAQLLVKFCEEVQQEKKARKTL